MKILQEYRLRKLKTALSTIRNDLLKRDFLERTKEIQALEQLSVSQSLSAGSQKENREKWMQAYKKLKIKLTGAKVIETPVK